MLRIGLTTVLLLTSLWIPVSRADGLLDRKRVQRIHVDRSLLESTLDRGLRRWPLLRQALRPDLQITQVGISEDSTPAFDYPKIDVWVRNAGHVPTQAFRVAVLYTRGGLPQAAVMKVMGGLAPGEHAMVRLDLSPQGGGLVQAYALHVNVDHAISPSDPYGAVLESNEQNNTWGPISFQM